MFRSGHPTWYFGIFWPRTIWDLGIGIRISTEQPGIASSLLQPMYSEWRRIPKKTQVIILNSFCWIWKRILISRSTDFTQITMVNCILFAIFIKWPIRISKSPIDAMKSMLFKLCHTKSAMQHFYFEWCPLSCISGRELSHVQLKPRAMTKGYLKMWL